ncbi:NAC domain-containing protein 82-like [Hibiscus syriacus]|uniref:NAC domain-containing protein 82-like n=1 Tax=Hibiscus syriacus TaxID=106335 RepID=UPI00192243DA|nr:NAC domain-containing protein 82-like [Hibiscus syriacus]
MGKNSLPPGFRFHPTDVGLMMYFLKRKVKGKKLSVNAIAEKGTRSNRATTDGYWKTTGWDKPVNHNNEVVGSIKTLVFHRGKAPRGERTDWLIHEYKLKEKGDSYVPCVLFNKDGKGPKNGAQYEAPFKDDNSPPIVSILEAAGNKCL